MSVFDPYGYLSRNDSISHRGQIIQPSPFFSSIPIHPSYIEKYKQFLESYGYHILKSLPSYFRYNYCNIIKHQAGDSSSSLTYQYVFIHYVRDILPTIDETFDVKIYIGLACANFRPHPRLTTSSWTAQMTLGKVYTFDFSYGTATQYIHIMSNSDNYFFFDDNSSHNQSLRKEVDTSLRRL